MIFISAGHHEKSQGAKYKDVTEYILTTKWADLIALLLGDKGIRVPNGTLKQKMKFINGMNFDNAIAVEIHFNSAKLWKDLNKNGIIDDNEMINVGRGSETLYCPGSKEGERIARIVQSAVGSLFKPDRGIKPGYYQMNPKKGPDFFLEQTNCPALIIEPEFIDNLDVINQNMNAACHLIASTLLDL
jgi:N-acetylmuramoyl-L-alanine amidase